MIGRFVSAVVPKFPNREKINEITQFFGKHPQGGHSRPVEQSLESAKSMLRWINNDGKEIIHFLENQT